MSAEPTPPPAGRPAADGASEVPALLETPLRAEHEALGAKIVPFAGWAMPVQYPSGIQAEHRAVRTAAGLFDVSHMGEFNVRGPDALALLGRVAVNDPGRMEIGQAQYSALCTPEGTLIDDLLLYRLEEDHFWVVVNASNRDVDFAWIEAAAEGLDVEVEDRSDDFALLALQGPRSEGILSRLTDLPLGSLGYYRFTHGLVAGCPALVARTGYTGEDGFELYLAADDGPAVWRALLAEGAPDGLIPAGLGARDSLRLEVGYPLYGHELDREHSALESGLGWIVKFDAADGSPRDFIGRDALLRQKADGITRRLVGIELVDRGFPRGGYPVVDADGRDVGVLTSGTVSPSLGTGVALGWVPSALAAPDTPVGIRIRDRVLAARVVRPPFYREGSIRR
jgi:aminomethyltransferase